MALSYITTLRNTRLADITTAVGTSGLLSIYSGTPPASANAALSGNTLCAQLALSATFAGAPSAGVLTANAITTETSANATGTVTFGRLNTSASSSVTQFTVGTSGTDMIINTTSIVAGSQVSCSSMTITEGNP